MNFELNKIRADEMEINVKSIIAQCMRKLGTIVICAFVFAVVISVLIYVRDLNNYNAVANNQSGSEEQTELTDMDYVAIETYNLLNSKLEQLAEYRDNSIILAMDFSNVYVGRLQYHIVADESVRYDIAVAISEFTNDGILASKVSDIEGFPEETYIQEILSSDIAGADDEAASGVASGVVNISVLGKTEEDCKEYLETVKQIIEEYDVLLQDSMAEHSLTLIQQECCAKYLSDVYTFQKSYLQEWKDINTEFTTHVSTLTEAQKREIFETVEGGTLITVAAKPSFSIKYAILGAVLGVLVALVAIFGAIIFGGRLQSEKELLKRLNICHFGNIYIANSKWVDKIIGKFLYGKKALNKEHQLEEISTRLQVFLQQSDVKKICLISTEKEISNETIMALSEMINKKGIECEIVGNVLKDTRALEKLSSKENIVLIETIGKSKIKEIYDESIVCLNAKARVVGYVSVQA